MRDPATSARSVRRRAGLRAAAIAVTLAGAGLGLAGGCSTSGRDLPPPTTTRPVTPRIIAPATTR